MPIATSINTTGTHGMSMDISSRSFNSQITPIVNKTNAKVGKPCFRALTLMTFSIFTHLFVCEEYTVYKYIATSKI